MRISKIIFLPLLLMLWLGMGGAWGQAVYTPPGGSVASVSAVPGLRDELKSAQQTNGLAVWFKGGISGKKIAFIGDSTTDVANDSFYTRMFRVTTSYGASSVSNGVPYASPYGLLAGMTMADDRDSTTAPSRPANFTTTNIINLGHNGQSLAGWLATQAATETALGADLYIFSYGINDVRVGTTNTSQLVTRIQQAIALFKANSPGCTILLRMPNSLQADDNGSTGYVTQGAYGSLALAAQAYTDILYNAYIQVYAMNYDNVALLDTQTTIFGRTVQTHANNPFMNDILHPSGIGYSAIADGIAKMIGQAPAYSQALADQARNLSYSAPYTSYARAVEDTNFWDVVLKGTLNAYGTTFLDITANGNLGANITIGDVIAVEGQTPFLATAAGGALTSTVVRIVQTISLPANTFGSVTVYRHKYLGDATVAGYMVGGQGLYPYQQKFRVQAGGNGFCDLIPMGGDGTLAKYRNSLTATDVLLAAGQTPLTLTSATFGASGTNLRITKAGTDFTAYVGKQVAVVGNHGPDVPNAALLDSNLRVTSQSKPFAVVSKTAAYTLLVTDEVIKADATTAAFTLTLPTAVGNAGVRFWLIKTDSGANAVTIATTLSQTINGAATISLSTQYQVTLLVSDGTNWLKLQ